MTDFAGDDTYMVDRDTDQVIEAPGGGTDTVESAINYTLAADFENLELVRGAKVGTGNAADNVISGRQYATLYTLNGEGGNDTLIGNKYDDKLNGGTGDDRYTVDSAGDQVIENPGEGHDRVTSSVDHTLAADVEDLQLTGTADLGRGNNEDNFIWGRSNAANWLYGEGGNDKLSGHVEADHLYGGSGTDTVSASDGADALDGGSGNDTLNGGRGDDTLKGGTGDDILNGGLDNDTFVFDDGDGFDTIEDFQAGPGIGDILDLRAVSDANGYADVINNHASDSVDGAFLDFAQVDILLSGVTVSQLEANDFWF